ncbi:hypothetical protein ALI144C_30680 [Actinosynnema sp. ALI-1.44]|uniref:hypothetical protein n=1 Tax=Actinosynnema sp. ALI-1.44 TaxID=1933779 RepID=UPI00097CAB9E|nr:hypothetical protein [Actinosynnema sp. ALI-1.44]ONI77805.1 hypothetical protein ALI144C_30680 [Actinosynnema sp. ALI-1.44]
MSTTDEPTAITLADLPVLASFPSWRGFALHSLLIVAVYRCVVCGRPRDSTMVATRGSGGELICPKCFSHLVRTDSRGVPAHRG